MARPQSPLRGNLSVMFYKNPKQLKSEIITK